MSSRVSGLEELEIIECVRSSAVFGGLAESALQELGEQFERKTLTAGEVLFFKGEPADALYVVLKGELDAIVQLPTGTELAVSTMGPGSTVGEIPLLFRGPRTATVRAKADTVLARLSQTDFHMLGIKHPELLQRFASVIRERLRRDRLVQILPQLFGSVDEKILKEVEGAVRWVRVRRGNRLFAQGDPGQSIFFNVSGRLCAVNESEEGEPRILREIPRGEIFGEMALFTGQARTASVYAIRDSELARIDVDRFDELVAHRPKLLRAVTGTVARRLQERDDIEGQTTRIVNVAVVPLSDDVPVGDFTRRVAAALARTDPTVHVDRHYVRQHLAEKATDLCEDSPFHVSLRTWLDQLELDHRFVLYEADAVESLWTLRSIRQADLVLLVGWASGGPELSDVERNVLAPEGELTAARRWLVLLHPNGTQLPSGTRRWLKGRRLELHHHVRWDTEEDFARISRFLSGRAIGLVLGGGGARGISHLGILRALTESGVSIDMVGGTSIGGWIATRYAMGGEANDMEREAREVFVHRKPFRELTVPIVSLVGPKRLTHFAKAVYGDARIEDLWLNCFCIACDISTGERIVLRDGTVWKAALATSALPGISAPVVDRNRLLVDGGVVDNLPASTMKELCGGNVIVVDVGPERELIPVGDRIPSPAEIVFSRLLPHRKPIPAPTIAHVMMRATMISSVKRREEACRLAMLRLRPPVEQFGLLEFASFEKIVDVGYRYGMGAIARWRECGDDEDGNRLRR